MLPGPEPTQPWERSLEQHGCLSWLRGERREGSAHISWTGHGPRSSGQSTGAHPPRPTTTSSLSTSGITEMGQSRTGSKCTGSHSARRPWPGQPPAPASLPGPQVPPFLPGEEDPSRQLCGEGRSPGGIRGCARWRSISPGPQGPSANRSAPGPQSHGAANVTGKIQPPRVGI